MIDHFVNLTPHVINIVGKEPLPPSGRVARVAETRETSLPSIKGVKVDRVVYGDLVGLPPRCGPGPITRPHEMYLDGETGKTHCQWCDETSHPTYIVSAMVAARCGPRDDVFSPGELVRDDAGRIIGAKGLTEPSDEVILRRQDAINILRMSKAGETS